MVGRYVHGCSRCSSGVGRLTGDATYYEEALRQVRGFRTHMFVEDKNLFRHGWIEAATDHPAFFWGRANGWALLSLCEVLDALPAEASGRAEALELLRKHVRGLASLQQKDWFLASTLGSQRHLSRDVVWRHFYLLHRSCHQQRLDRCGDIRPRGAVGMACLGVAGG